MREVSYEEYLTLKRRVEELEAKQEKQEKEIPLAIGWAYAVRELPIYGVGLTKGCTFKKPVCYYKTGTGTGSAWTLFTGLAKQIHAEDTFRATNCTRNIDIGLYSWDKRSHTAPRVFNHLTYEQKLLSLQMLNELIPIYNKYYKLAHPYAGFFDVTGKVFDLQISDEQDVNP